MSPKNKNRRKKKNYKRRKINTNNIVADTEGQKLTVGQENKKGTNKPKKMPCVQKNCFLLVEQTTRRLKEDDSGKLVAILERIFSIFNDDPKKVARLELIDKLLSNVKEYETKDIGGLKIQLNSIFFPKELKKLMVNARDFKQTFNPLLFLLGLGFFEHETYLDKGRRKIRVQIKEAHGTKGKLTILQEAKTLSQLSHDNIIKILAFDKMGPRFAIEYMKLGSLDSALEQYDFTSQKIMSILKNVASAMAYLSEKQYVLRNLKSENILLDSDGVCKIGDFQYCQYVGDDPDGTYIDQNTTLDLDFAAPEVNEEKCFSTKSDVWDFALLACEVFNVTPQKAMNCFPGMLRPTFIGIFVSDDAFPLPPKCPYPLWSYLKTRLLEEDPKMRPTFKEILEELKKYDSWRLD